MYIFLKNLFFYLSLIFLYGSKNASKSNWLRQQHGKYVRN